MNASTFKSLLFLLFSSLITNGELLTQDQLSGRLKAVQEAEATENTNPTLTIWQEALVAAKSAKQSQDLATTLTKQLSEAKLPTFTLPSAPNPSANANTLNSFLESLASSISETETQLAELTSENKKFIEKNASLVELITRTKSKVASFSPPPLGNDELSRAEHQKALQLETQLKATLDQATAEQALIRKNYELYPKKAQLTQSHLEALTLLQTTTRERLATLRNEDAATITDQLDAHSTTFAKAPPLLALVNEVQELNNLRLGETQIQSQLTDAIAYKKNIETLRSRIQSQEANARKRIKLLESANLGIDTDTSLLLRAQRSRLPKITTLSAELSTQLENSAEAQMTILNLEEQASPLATLSQNQINTLLKKHPKLKQSEIDNLLTLRSNLVTSLSRDYRSLNTTLTQATETSKLTIADIKRYSKFLDQRLLWIRSTHPITASEPIQEWNRIRDLFSPDSLKKVGQSMITCFPDSLFINPSLLLICLLIVGYRKKLINIAHNASLAAARRNCTSFIPTIKCLLARLLLAAALPTILLLAFRLIQEPAAFRMGLMNCGIFLFSVLIIYHYSRPEGLFESHLKINKNKTALLQKTAKIAIPIGLPFIFLVGALTQMSDTPSSGRFIFVIAMIPVTFFAHRLFHPSRSLLKNNNNSNRSFTKAIYLLAIATPLSFATGAALGFFSSVLILRAQVIATIGLLALAFILIQLFTRWILVSRRRLAIAQALRRREAAIAERENNDSSEKDPDLPSLDEVKAEAVNVVEVEEQTTHLLKLSVYLATFFALWAVWSSSLPALSVIDNVTLWGDDTPTTTSSAPSSPLPTSTLLPTAPDAPEETTALSQIVEPSSNRVSLQDLLLAILFFFLTFTAAKNIPGLLSLTLFNRLNLGHGGNFALTTSARYVIVVVGIVLALGKIAITWSKVQWIAAAITLGIGFGLQEVFANFVAGIILLFERPIRLGDLVTVGDINGKITQIKIRATTIRQLNNRELIVPNKDFITGSLVNWTLNDSILRLEVPVGVAYGSDMELAKKTLLQVAKDHPKIIDEPAPDVIFTSFGGSSLDLKLRGFVDSPDHFIPVQSELHFDIDKAFRKANIEIAFPQQDLHIRSIPEELSLNSTSPNS